MTHNDILRRVRYILDARDNKIASIFAKADHEVTTEQVNRWLKRDDDPKYVELTAAELALFLDGLIIDQRGPKDGPKVKYVQEMNNNLILMKLKIALNLKAEDVLHMMELAEFKISKHELSALFRKKDHKHYRVCKNQILRKFLKGVQIKYRGQKTSNETKPSVSSTQPTNKPTSKTVKVIKKVKVDKPVKTNTDETKPKTPSKAASVWKKAATKSKDQ